MLCEAYKYMLDIDGCDVMIDVSLQAGIVCESREQGKFSSKIRKINYIFLIMLYMSFNFSRPKCLPTAKIQTLLASGSGTGHWRPLAGAGEGI